MPASRIKPAGHSLAVGKVKRIDAPEHLAFVRSLPCIASGVTTGVIAHHITLSRYRMGRKAGDDLAVPLNTVLHTGHTDSLHELGEARFWNELGIDPFAVARFLWDNTGKRAECVAEVAAQRAAASVRRIHSVKLFREKAA